MSSTVLRVGGYRFYFFSREESRPHVHVQCGGGEAKIWLEPRVAVAANSGLTPTQLKAAVRIVEGIWMKSAKRGRGTSAVEVTNVSRQGFWLVIGSKETFVAFKEFPWFRDASIAAITAVERPSANHLYWPELDIDLAVDSIYHPERYPLVSKAPQVKERKARVYTPLRRRGGRNPENRVRPGTPRT